MTQSAVFCFERDMDTLDTWDGFGSSYFPIFVKPTASNDELALVPGPDSTAHEIRNVLFDSYYEEFNLRRGHRGKFKTLRSWRKPRCVSAVCRKAISVLMTRRLPAVLPTRY